MKKLILTFAVILATAAQGMAATVADTIRVYKIDGEMCKTFTGQELVGKTVLSYKISHVPFTEKGKTQKHVLETHEIETTTKGIKTTKTVTKLSKPLIIVDGEEKDVKISDIAPDDIQSVDVFKDPTICAAYGEKAAGGVIRIVTKTCKTDPIVYLVGGEVMSSAKMKTIPSSNIKDVQIYKAGTAEAKKYSNSGALMVVTLK